MGLRITNVSRLVISDVKWRRRPHGDGEAYGVDFARRIDRDYDVRRRQEPATTGRHAVWRASRVLRICYLTGRKESDIPHIDSEVARELRSVPRRALW